jgi:hypothetical protein
MTTSQKLDDIIKDIQAQVEAIKKLMETMEQVKKEINKPDEKV